MQAHPISDNQQTFNGYIEPKLKKSIKKNLLKSVKYLKDYKTDLKKERYQVLLGQGKRTTEKLEKFVAPLQKDTSIGVHEDCFLFLSNPVTTGKSDYFPGTRGILICNESGGNNTWWSFDRERIYVDVYTGIDKNLASRYLEKIELAMDTINKCIKPKEIDEAFLKMAERDLRNYSDKNLTGINFIDKFLINRAVKKIEKYAESIEKTTNAKAIAEKRLKELKGKKANKQKIGNRIKRIWEKIKRGLEEISKNKRTDKDKQLTKQYISEVNKLSRK